MKYIKTYEERKKPKVGDYVVVNPEKLKKRVNFKNKISNFISSNIGKIIYRNVKENTLTVAYFNVPDKLIYSFQNVKYKGGIKCYTFFTIDAVIDFSENPKDLEYILTSKKYNL